MSMKSKIVMSKDYYSAFVFDSESKEWLLNSRIYKSFSESSFWLFSKCSELKCLGYDISFDVDKDSLN